jgi:hypothetical protein
MNNAMTIVPFALLCMLAGIGVYFVATSAGWIPSVVFG